MVLSILFKAMRIAAIQICCLFSEAAFRHDLMVHKMKFLPVILNLLVAVFVPVAIQNTD